MGYLALLSLIQGMTEFLPVSSSAHLIVLPYLMNVPDQGVVIDIAAHAGSLLAVLCFYRARIFRMAISLFGRGSREDRRLAHMLMASTAPVLIFAGALFLWDINAFRRPGIVVITSALFGIALYIADRRGGRGRGEGGMKLKDAILIGMAQALALVPGVSRSGISISMARARGFSRESAVDFAFLMSIPAIMLAAMGAGVEYIKDSGAASATDAAFAALCSFAFSMAAIKLMLCWVRRFSLSAFALYRLLFAAATAALIFK